MHVRLGEKPPQPCLSTEVRSGAHKIVPGAKGDAAASLRRHAERCLERRAVILLVDNYDSFVWNLVQRIGELQPQLEVGRDLMVARNDEITAAQAASLDRGRGPSHIILSPGPCGPREAGESLAIIKRFAGRIPILGVCLGHQCIGAAYGMEVRRHAVPVHGKTSAIRHDSRGLFTGVPDPFVAMRYHSLVVPASAVPPGWEVSAWADEDDGAGGVRHVVMGLRRLWEESGKAPLEGIQFHPESFLTESGPRLLANFLAMGHERIEAGADRQHAAGGGAQ
jgi:anthranilate synthase/aminodeoxychorismate synthase-like glutamine amidotransferase